MKKYSLLFIFVGLLVFVTLAGVSCRRGPDLAEDEPLIIDDSAQPSDEVVIDDSLLPPASGLANPTEIRSLVITERQQADEAVKSLQQDAVLQLVSTKFINSLSNQTGLSTNYYIYSSISNPSFYYLINLPRNGERPKRFLMPIEDLDLPFDLMPVPMEFWKLTYAAALSEAEQRGGAEFRAKHPTFEVSTILARPAGQFLSWFVTYRATDGSGDMLKVAVDANTGETTLI